MPEFRFGMLEDEGDREALAPIAPPVLSIARPAAHDIRGDLVGEI
jgi:hypothetical protein